MRKKRQASGKVGFGPAKVDLSFDEVMKRIAKVPKPLASRAPKKAQ